MGQHIKFINSEKTDFYRTLRERVDSYFETNKISPHANGNMAFKTVFMLALYFLPFYLIASTIATGWAFWACWMMMGFGMAGIGMSVMHDANHKAYSSSNAINTLMGYTLNLVGGDAENWRLQHNILHHTFTNIHSADEDVSDKPGLRFSPGSKHHPAHGYQFIYAFFLYTTLTLFWVLLKDFFQFFRYRRTGLTKSKGWGTWKALISLMAWKAFYITYTLIIPIYVMGIPAGQMLLGFLLMHLISGTILSLVFQLAHVIESAQFPTPDTQGNIQTEWAIHQLCTTADFSPRNKLITFYVGGLNYQIEHHLFPLICHVHYPKIAPIVAATAKEYGLPYHTFPTFGSALRSHVRLLKSLGMKDYNHLVEAMG